MLSATVVAWLAACRRRRHARGTTPRHAAGLAAFLKDKPSRKDVLEEEKRKAAAKDLSGCRRGRDGAGGQSSPAPLPYAT